MMKAEDFRRPFIRIDVEENDEDIKMKKVDYDRIFSEETSELETQSMPITQKQSWSKAEVEKALSNLPMGKDALRLLSTLNDLAQTVKEFYHKYEQRNILRKSYNYSISIKLLIKWPETCLLISSWLGHVEIVRALLDKGASLNICDYDGRTPLHLAACNASVKVVEELLERGADPNKWDNKNKFTALHCAAAAGCVDAVESLIRHKADVKTQLSDKSPLYYAILNNAEHCVRALLQAGACPDQKVGTMSLLHVAVNLGYINCVNLLLSCKANVNVRTEKSKSTPLHYAAKNGNAECTSSLLIRGAHKEAKNCLGQTAMHLAVLALSVKTVNVLIRQHADVNAEDNEGRIPLQVAENLKAYELVKILIQADALMNKMDSEGHTLLHKAVLRENLPIVEILLLKGADVTARTIRGITALSLIVRRTPNALPYFMEWLDHGIQPLYYRELADADCELKLDFRRLVPKNRGEMDLILCLLEVGQNHVLKHPLCESYLYFKWLRIRKFFLLGLIFHLIFVALFTNYIGVTYLWDSMQCTHFSRILFWPLLSFTWILICKELFHVAHGICSYIRRWENWLQWSVILLSCAVLIWPVRDWQYHAAALGILLAWIKLMMVVGHFYMLDSYIQMFKQVSINFFKCYVAYLCLIIGFSLSFSVLYKNYESFTNPLISLLKTTIMMSGELEFEHLFFNKEHQLLFPGTAHLILLSFFLFVTVILMNLMIGLAVSDIQELRKSIGLDRLVRRAKLVAELENMLFSELSDYVSTKIINACRKSALLLGSYDCDFRIRPNDPREKRLPRELIKETFNLVIKRRMEVATVKNVLSETYSQKCASKSTHLDSSYVKLSSNESDQQDLNTSTTDLKKCLYNISMRMDNMNDKLDNITYSRISRF